MENRVNQLKEYIEGLIKSGVSQTEIGKQLGYSRSQVSKFVDGGSVSDEFLEAVERIMEEKPLKVENQFKRSVADLEFIHTKDAINILGICKATEDINGFGAVLGNAGTGKTETVKQFVKASERAVYIRCNCLMAVKDIIKATAKACGAVLQANSKSDMFIELAEFLQDNPRTIVYDEVDQIMPIKNINKVETIRNLHDMVKDNGTSVIMVGSPAVEHHFKKRNMNENYGQIDSRIDYVYKTHGLDERELISILSEFEIDKLGMTAMGETIMKTSKGGIRWLTKILTKCLDIAEDGRITKEVVKGATEIMMI